MGDAIRQELDHQEDNGRRNERVQDLPANREETEPDTNSNANDVL